MVHERLSLNRTNKLSPNLTLSPNTVVLERPPPPNLSPLPRGEYGPAASTAQTPTTEHPTPTGRSTCLALSQPPRGLEGLGAPPNSVVEAADPGADGGGGGRGEDKRHSRSLDSFPDLESPRSGPSPQTLGRGGDVK